MNASSARRRGSAWAWSRSLSRSSRSRSTSSGGNVGRSRTSARSSRAGAQPGRRHVDADARGVPAGVGVERGAQPLARLGQADRVVSLGALGQRPRRQDGGAALVRRLVDGTGGQDQRRADQRTAGQVGDEHRQPVVELCPGDGREVVRPRRPGGRALGDDVPVALELVGGGHAATSSSCSASVSASFSASASTASESAGGDLGQVGQDEPVVRPEGRGGDLEDRLRRDREIARQHLVDEARVVEQRRVHRQPVGAFLDPLECPELVRLDQREGAGQLVGAHRLRGQALDLLVQRRLDALDRDARPDRGPAGAGSTRRR